MDDLVQWFGEQLDEDELTTRVAYSNPSQRLLEIDAKRRIIALHEPGEMNDVDGDVCMVCEDPDMDDEGPFYPCRTLRLLALPYADRPGYLAEWAPTT
ncbi:DUF6221 family protein [Streptomyces sp. NPDC057757]|uniref:DUF6221 family protein n=1 Tax=Streptomyces sp. NPDC057757 TaxID=3346241 RepID=UPI0036A5504F